MSYNFKIFINSYNYEKLENHLREVYVFIKNMYYDNTDFIDIEELNDTYSDIDKFLESQLYREYFNDLFDDLDKIYIKEYAPKITFVDENIYEDDNVETIKLKIIKHYNDRQIDTEKYICYEELYLFGLINKPYNPLEIYNKLTNFGKNKLSQEILFEYLGNINEQKKILEILETKENYVYEDLYKITIESINILTPIGQSVNSKFNYSYSIDPFKVVKFNNILKTMINSSINTSNSNFLFDYNLSSQSLFVTLFNDTNEFINIKEIDNTEIMIKLYFPLLAEKGILSLDRFLSEKKTLIKKTNNFISNEIFKRKNEIIDLMHNINYNSKQFDSKIKGIENINFNIHSKINLNISIDSIFKLINSSKKIPFIKFNPGNKMENIYRFYCNKISKNNKKIPLVSKEKIIKYIKTFGRPNTILIILNTRNEIIKEFVLELENNGTLNVKIELNSIIKIDELNGIIKKYVNLFFTTLSENIPNFYDSIDPFDSLFDSNVEILNINYKMLYVNTFKYSLTEFNKIKNCVSNILNSSQKSEKSTIKNYRYKKVSNYDETNAINSFIIENIKMNCQPIEIVYKLKNEFDFKTIEDAKEFFETTIQSLNLVENLFNYKKLKIKNNPGFSVSIEKISGNLEINIDNIDNINYIRFINLYFDSLIKIILSSNGEDFINKDKYIDFTLCRDSKKIKDTHFTEDNVNTLDRDKNFEKTERLDLDDILSIASEPNDDLLDILLDDGDEDGDKDDDEEDHERDDDINIDREIIDDDIQDNHDKKEKTSDKDSDSDSDMEDSDSDMEDDMDIDIDMEDDIEDDMDMDMDMDMEDDMDKETSKSAKNKSKKSNISNTSNTSNRSNKKKYELTRLENYENVLFNKDNPIKNKTVKNVNNFFKQYSRTCQHERQPIIITQEEKDEIDRISPSSYKYILEYQTSLDKKFYYICPHFWDKQRNISLTREQVMSGNFGKINDNILDRKQELLPRLMSKNFDSLDKDFCLPCCYGMPKKPYDLKKDEKVMKCLKKTKKKLDRMANRMGEDNEISNYSYSDSENYSSSNGSDTDSESEDYSNYQSVKDSISNSLKKIYITREHRNIMGQGKVSILPMIVSNFLQYDTTLCFEKGEGNFLKSGHRCLLRYGVEKTLNNNQTFVACIADAYCKYNNVEKTISVREFKKMLIENFTIDNFISCNNGNLTHIFLSKNIDDDFFEKMDIAETYKSSNFYSNLNMENINQVNLYKKIINSYENFQKYLNSKHHIIDHTYLWDIVSKPNGFLFKDGINLIILDITSEDITQNIKVLCPKSSYSNQFIDANKLNLILIKNNNIYEPIYAIKDTSMEKRVVSLFSFDYEKDEIYLLEFKRVLNILKDDLNERCIKNNNIEKYDFETNITLNNLIKILDRLKYEILYQIMNYENKIIGVMVSYNGNSNGFLIPCFPSEIDNEKSLDLKFMDDGEIQYNNYQDTKMFLEKIYEDSKHKIKVNPKYKILEDGLIIGILTNGDQFVLISPYEIYKQEDNIPVLEENNYLVKNKTSDGTSDETLDETLDETRDKNYKDVDLLIQTKYNKDEDRIASVTNIKLESGFYESFKNTIVKILKNPLNKSRLINIQKIINDFTILYFEKLRLIKEELETLSSDKIKFIEYDRKILESIKTISTCMDNKCDTDFCMKNPDDSCSLIVQKTNLINEKDNEEIYYLKLSDEFIRNIKTKNFLFENKNMGLTIRYNIDKNELVLLHSSLNYSLFDNRFATINNYENYTNYDTFGESNKIVLDSIDTADFKERQKQKDIKLDSIQQNKKINIRIPKLTLDTIKEIAEQSEKEGRESEKEASEKDSREARESEKEDMDEAMDEDMDDIETFISNANELCKSRIENNVLRETGIKENFKIKNLKNIFFTLNTEEDINCSYELFILILKHNNKIKKQPITDINIEDINIEDLKKILIGEYLLHDYTLGLLINSYQYVLTDSYIKFLGDFEYKKIIEDLINKKYKTKDLTDEYLRECIEKIINNSKYYLTYIDIYLLAKKFGIPLIFITNTIININSIKSATNIKKYMLCNIDNTTNKYYFIKLPSIHYREIMKINQLIHGNNSITIDIDRDINNFNNLSNDINESIRSNEDLILEAVVNSEKIVEKTKVLKKYNFSSKQLTNASNVSGSTSKMEE